MKTSYAVCFCLLVLLSSFCYPRNDYDSKIQRVERWEKRVNTERHSPEIVKNAIGVKPGMVIGEVGAGRGRYTVLLAEWVGKSGKVLANDIDKKALSFLKERCRRNNISNIETVLGEIDDPLLPEGKLDMVFMIWVYHMLDQPVPLLKKLRHSLKKGATLVIVDPPDEEIDREMEQMTGKKTDPNRPPIREKIENGGKAAGFELIKVDNCLPKDTIYILRVK